jgi:hypothetical protein
MKRLLIDWFEGDNCLGFDSNDPRSNSFWAEDESEDLLILELATWNIEKLKSAVIPDMGI